jgi:hypothetical protein
MVVYLFHVPHPKMPDMSLTRLGAADLAAFAAVHQA